MEPFKNLTTSRRQQAVSSTLFPLGFLAFFSPYPILRIILLLLLPPLLAESNGRLGSRAWRCRAGI